MSRGKETRVVRGREVAAWCGVTCCARITVVVVSLLLSCRDGKREGGERKR